MLKAGTHNPLSSDPRTNEQNAWLAAARRLNNGELSGEYAGTILLPDGTVGSINDMVVPPARVTEVQEVLDARGKPTNYGRMLANGQRERNGGYVVALREDGIPVQYLGVASPDADEPSAAPTPTPTAVRMATVNALPADPMALPAIDPIHVGGDFTPPPLAPHPDANAPTLASAVSSPVVPLALAAGLAWLVFRKR